MGCSTPPKKKQLAIFFCETTVFFSRKGEGIPVLNSSCSVWMQASNRVQFQVDALLIPHSREVPSSNLPDSNRFFHPTENGERFVVTFIPAGIMKFDSGSMLLATTNQLLQ